MKKKEIENYIDILIKNSEEAIIKNEVPISCLFISENKMISIFHNLTNKTKNATKHCEMICIDSAFKTKKDLSDVIAIVTVEPCLMCGYALFLAKLKKVYFVLSNNKFGGVGSLYNIKLNYEIINYRNQDIKSLLQKFYEIGNLNIKPEQRHRFKKDKKEKHNLINKKLKSN